MSNHSMFISSFSSSDILDTSLQYLGICISSDCRTIESTSIEMAARIMILSFSQQESSQKEAQALGEHLKAASLKDMGYCSLDEQCFILKILLGLDDINAIITIFERICNAWWTGEWTITMVS